MAVTSDEHHGFVEGARVDVVHLAEGEVCGHFAAPEDGVYQVTHTVKVRAVRLGPPFPEDDEP